MFKSCTVVVGASSGIGAGLALREACDRPVCLLGRRMDLLKGVVEQIEAAGGYALAVSCDVTDEAQCHAAISRCLEWGMVDRVIYNSGVAESMFVDAFSTQAFDQVFQTNFYGLVYTLSAIMPQFLAQNKGHVVGISSLASLVVGPGSSAYCVSKTAMNVLLTGLRRDTYQTEVDVTIICPGFIKTALTQRNRFKMPLLMEVDQAVKQIYSAIERRKRFYAFPFVLVVLLKVFSALPLCIQDFILSKHRYDKS